MNQIRKTSRPHAKITLPLQMGRKPQLNLHSNRTWQENCCSVKLRDIWPSRDLPNARANMASAFLYGKEDIKIPDKFSSFRLSAIKYMRLATISAARIRVTFFESQNSKHIPCIVSKSGGKNLSYCILYVPSLNSCSNPSLN